MKKLKWCLVFLLLALGVVAYGQMDLEEALALFPTGSDLMVEYSDTGRTQLEEAIDAFRHALGVTVSFDELDEEAYGTLEMDIEKKDLANKLSQCYYTLGDVFLRDEDGVAKIFERGRLWGLVELADEPRFCHGREEARFHRGGLPGDGYRSPLLDLRQLGTQG